MVKMLINNEDRSGTNSRGFTLIEVLCSVAIFSVLFMSAFFIQLNVLKVKDYNEEINRCTLIMEHVKNNIIYNFDYEDVLKLYKDSKIYINCSNLNIEDIENTGADELFSDVKPAKEPYVILNVTEGKVLKINLRLYRNTYRRIVVDECEFYKGNYRTQNEN
ncbi:prepilin-type N-terminal cleavage/methylation domain-containing protein [Clostridium luticellarii]|jgi:prepilin-type N-terminal cleavage/methylation domain-containing protein|uniref:Prepilin-type N-terminal cleavage/methylation domain-containing protein n=1 Tax=Clostridium luticellarii TaxID=1691940 RepID=A0A2T0BRQ8_9CLOT|nr:prepilin-type N-terminal cleavage/methylation domain-containing protein [Clostridium luticellarii]MCI1943734.1 prepilin-type N-terminal cleavage/methylation domain-containing protein [Clostridium luticellarii]MCI1966995.1 prepilin-type N-terminal cleavage/methylation domain-containing protein [Clostridium luticellarii]MCI1994362.1 prepilin-type N-terminal cleavage/methylation domain-containing protein [Clostridium luticellarii]MCI2038685.1 prepilin-type N-terminal cleavage/methylation domain